MPQIIGYMIQVVNMPLILSVYFKGSTTFIDSK